MPATPLTSPVHSSVHTSTSLNWQGTGSQELTVLTSRLVIAWRDGELMVGFEMQRTRTGVLSRQAQNSCRKERM